MRLVTQIVALIAIVVSAAAGVGQAGAASLEAMLAERSLGNADAPVTMVEFSSLTCPHCATFHAETLPQIKEAYIDTGKVRLVYRDFPIGATAAGAAMVARCLPAERYFGFIDVLYRDLEKWTAGDQPYENLERLARLGGLSKEEFAACIENKSLWAGIQERVATAKDEHGVESTPTFLVDGEKIVGAQSFATFKAAIDKALSKSGEAKD